MTGTIDFGDAPFAGLVEPEARDNGLEITLPTEGLIRDDFDLQKQRSSHLSLSAS